MRDKVHFSGRGTTSYEEGGEVKELTYIVFVPHKSQRKIEYALKNDFSLKEIETDSKDKNIVYVLKDGIPKKELSTAERAIEDLFKGDPMMKRGLPLHIEFIENLEEKLEKENFKIIKDMPEF